MAKKTKEIEEKEIIQPIKDTHRSGGNGKNINWEELEKEFQELYRSGDDSVQDRMKELKTLALGHDREFVTSGISSWLVEFVFDEDETDIRN